MQPHVDRPSRSNLPLPSPSTLEVLPFEENRPPARPQQVRLFAHRDIRSACLEVLPATHGDASQNIEMQCVRVGGDTRVFQADVPAEHVAARRHLLVHLRDAVGSTVRVLPTEGPLPAAPAPLYIAHNQLFLYDPPRFVSAPHRESFDFTPRAFRPRRVQVLLPRAYRENRHLRYPVLIVQDGQNVFHPGSQFGSWDLDWTIMRLIARAEIREIIVVAIDNTHDRFAEYAPEYGKVRQVRGRAGEFATMLRDELLPVLRDRYRISPSPEETGHIGSSLGGLLGFHIANEHSDAFGVVAALSPSFWVNFPENQRRAAKPPQSRARLWIDSGCAGINSDGYENTIRIRDALLGAGHVLGSRFMHIVALGHEHREHDWARRCPDILRWMYPPPAAAPPMAPLDSNLVFA